MFRARLRELYRNYCVNSIRNRGFLKTVAPIGVAGGLAVMVSGMYDDQVRIIGGGLLTAASLYFWEDPRKQASEEDQHQGEIHSVADLDDLHTLKVFLKGEAANSDD